ncbi:E3 ubiquitin-protein ligase TRIM33-like [Mytilus edulis]|uniref:E3 ubiquitin-protein ligase TRIM33-like n=1 Tax=Mytilus edulis TaxID=6550 RepID=UPI0039EFAA29
MASTSGTCCGVCETQHVVIEAAFWCPECDEGLCALCEKHHQASKGTRNHKVTSVNDYKQIPPSIASINQYCSDHEKKYHHYCAEHEKLCCPLCITTNHKKCDLLALDEIVKTSKTSAFFYIMEQSLIDMKSNMEKIMEDRKQNLEIIQHQRHQFKADIKTIRSKFNKHLDKLEQDIQQDIRAAEHKVKSQIKRLLSKLSDHGKTIDRIQNDISSTKSFGTDLQTFFGGKIFEAEIQKEEKFMQSLKEDGGIQQINLIWRIDDKISGILSMKTMGEISVKFDPPTINMTTEREKQAQQMVPEISKTINDISLTLSKRFKI